MVYIVNAEFCQSGFELSRKRNILFTGITRSRCWVRLFGVGDQMAGIRFDFAPKAAKDFHPASHITINSSECRIPARAPLQFDTFIKFVLENFYAEAWQHSAIAKVLSFREEEECLSAHDKGRAYVTWAYPK